MPWSMDRGPVAQPSVWQRHVRPAVCAAAALLVIVIGVGHYVASPCRRLRLRRDARGGTGSVSEIAAMRSEMHDLREMVSLSLMQQQSASERLKGVSWTGQIDRPSSEVVSALLDALMHDPNVNVRLGHHRRARALRVARTSSAARHDAGGRTPAVAARADRVDRLHGEDERTRVGAGAPAARRWIRRSTTRCARAPRRGLQQLG